MAFASSFAPIANDNSPRAGRTPKLRFETIVSLDDNPPAGVSVTTDLVYEEHAFFGFARGEEFSCPATWLGQVVERAGRVATMRGLTDRPIAIVAPSAALSHRNAPMAAEAGAARARMCPQEFRLEFSDSALCEEEDNAFDFMVDFYRRGFRLGINATSSWQSPFSHGARELVEAVRLNAQDVLNNEIRGNRIETAMGADICLYAQDACWQNAKQLRDLGVSYAVEPRADG